LAVVLGWYAALVAIGVAIIAALPGPDPNRYCMGCEAGFFDPQTSAVLFVIGYGACGLAIAIGVSTIASDLVRGRFRHVASAGAVAVGIGMAAWALAYAGMWVLAFSSASRGRF
jgi:hypothetical protein